MLAGTQIVTESTLYWITRLDGLKGVVIGVGIVLLIVFILCTIISLIARYEGDGDKSAGKFILLSLVGIILSVFFMGSRTFIPTTKEMCAIKAIPMIVNNDEVQEIPDKVLELATKWIEELKPKPNVN